MPSSLAATISAAVTSSDAQDAPIWLQTVKVAVRLKNLSGLGCDAAGVSSPLLQPTTMAVARPATASVIQ